MIKSLLHFYLCIVALPVFCQFNHGFDKLIHLTSEEGLSNNSIMAIEKDAEGFMWIGTKFGLNKFDGERFTLYKSIENDTTSLNDNFIRSLESDKDGYIWIGSKEGINRYNLHTKKIESIPLIGSKKNKIQSVFTICRMRNSDVWFGAPNYLYIYKKEQEKLIEIPISNLGSGTLQNKVILSIFQDSKHQIWVGTHEGLYRAVHNPNCDPIISLVKVTSDTSEDIFIKDITEDIKGNLWIGTENKGLWTYNSRANLLERTKDKRLANLEIRSLQFDEEENLWIASFSGLTIRKKEGTVNHLADFSKTEDPTNDGFKSIFMNNDGSIWIGGYSGGLKIWNKTFNSFSFLRNLLPEKEINFGLVNTLTEDSKGNIYLGTKKNGISVLDKNRVVQKRITTILTEALEDVTVKSCILEGNLLWIATLEKGVLVFDITKEQFLTDILSTELHSLLNGVKVYSIAKSKNKIAVGTLGDGLILYDISTKKIHYFSRNEKIEGGILGNIRVVYFDTNHNLWIGTLTGIKCILAKDLENNSNTIKQIRLTKDEIDNPSEILSINEDYQGQLLIGTGKHGFFIKNERTIQKIDLADVKSNVDPIMGIAEDTEHNIWLCTHKEIIKYNPSLKKAYLFDQNYGITKTEFRNQSALHATNEYVYFGTSWGILYFKADQIQPIEDASSVTITSFALPGEKGMEPQEKQIIKTDKINDQKVILAHNENSFTISFSSLEFTKILDNTYEYRLIGLHEDWKSTTNATVNYILQKSGDYEFQVRNKKFSERGTNTITTLPIYLKTPPWKSSYAVVIYILCITLGIFGVYKILRSKATLKHQLALENLEKKKEKEKYASQIEFFTDLSHDFRTPLTLILAPLQQLIENYQGKSIMYTKLVSIQRNADQLLHLVNQLLDFRKVETKKSNLRIQKGNIVQSLKDIYKSFEEFSKLGDYTYTFETSSNEIFLYYDLLSLEKVFYNLISNAFKNTAKSNSIAIAIIEKKEQVLIEIKDTGNGIDEELMTNIFNRFFNAANTKGSKDFFEPGIGIGLHVAKKIIEQHKGTITVRSKKNQGSVFSIALKKGTAHLKEYTIQNNASPTSELRTPMPHINEFTTSVDMALLGHDQQNSSKRFSVLIVEDNDELRKLMADILKPNFNVTLAIDGKKGFIKVLQKKIDLIISDAVMPEMDGIELCYKIKNDNRTSHIPFIMLTSRSASSQKLVSLESGADAYVTKPFVINELLLLINNLLRTYNQSNRKLTIDPNFANYEQQIDSEDEKLYKKAMKIIYENLHDSSFEMDAFSKELAISRRQLYRKIKNWTGQTPKEFLQSVRLKKASHLLEIGEMTISEVCYEVGFGNPKYFARCFKKQFHQTPSEYSSKFYKDS